MFLLSQASARRHRRNDDGRLGLPRRRALRRRAQERPLSPLLDPDTFARDAHAPRGAAASRPPARGGPQTKQSVSGLWTSGARRSRPMRPRCPVQSGVGASRVTVCRSSIRPSRASAGIPPRTRTRPACGRCSTGRSAGAVRGERAASSSAAARCQCRPRRRRIAQHGCGGKREGSRRTVDVDGHAGLERELAPARPSASTPTRSSIQFSLARLPAKPRSSTAVSFRRRARRRSTACPARKGNVALEIDAQDAGARRRPHHVADGQREVHDRLCYPTWTNSKIARVHSLRAARRMRVWRDETAPRYDLRLVRRRRWSISSASYRRCGMVGSGADVRWDGIAILWTGAHRPRADWTDDGGSPTGLNRESANFGDLVISWSGDLKNSGGGLAGVAFGWSEVVGTAGASSGRPAARLRCASCRDTCGCRPSPAASRTTRRRAERPPRRC